jgi:hypothetical protein
MSKYTIVESVGRVIQQVHDYGDLERHHPSRGNERGRVYATVNGEREEVLGNYRGTPVTSILAISNRAMGSYKFMTAPLMTQIER